MEKLRTREVEKPAGPRAASWLEGIMFGLSVVEKRDERDLVDIDGRVGRSRCGLLDVNAAIRGRLDRRKLADMNFIFCLCLWDEFLGNSSD